ncbi:MAG: hypothetical protein KGI50_06695 [Patescibacteria group bacterium]|nr:hypothetical protein [Patescibacteria group bacterium]
MKRKLLKKIKKAKQAAKIKVSYKEREIKRPEAGKRRRIEVRKKLTGAQIKKLAIDKFYKWAAALPKQQQLRGGSSVIRKMLKALERGKLNHEGNGWYQLGTYRNKGNRVVKIRISPNQKRIEIYIRGNRYA